MRAGTEIRRRTKVRLGSTNYLLAVQITFFAGRKNLYGVAGGTGRGEKTLFPRNRVRSPKRWVR